MSSSEICANLFQFGNIAGQTIGATGYQTLAIPSGTLSVPISVHIDDSYFYVCDSISSLFPLQFRIAPESDEIGVNYQGGVACDPISYATASANVGKTIVINCNFPKTPTGYFNWVGELTDGYGVRSPFITKWDSSQSGETLCDASLTLGPTPSGTVKYDTTDATYIPVTFSYDQWYCAHASRTFTFLVTAFDPANNDYGYSVDPVTTGTYSFDTIYTQSDISFHDLAAPTRGQMRDGQWEIVLAGLGANGLVQTADASFTIAHNPAPAPSGGGTTRRKRMERRWEDAFVQGLVDEAAFLLAPMQGASCAFTQCPVWGQPGVFECIDTSTSLDSCGGCPSQAHARSCSDIVGAAEMECVAGRCVVHRCEEGWRVATTGDGCE